MKKDRKQELKEALIELLLTLLCLAIGALTASMLGVSIESDNVSYDLIILLGLVIFFVTYGLVIALVKWFKKKFKSKTKTD